MKETSIQPNQQPVISAEIQPNCNQQAISIELAPDVVSQLKCEMIRIGVVSKNVDDSIAIEFAKQIIADWISYK